MGGMAQQDIKFKMGEMTNDSAIDIKFIWLGQKIGGNGSTRFQVYLAQLENVGNDSAYLAHPENEGVGGGGGGMAQQ